MMGGAGAAQGVVLSTLPAFALLSPIVSALVVVALARVPGGRFGSFSRAAIRPVAFAGLALSAVALLAAASRLADEPESRRALFVHVLRLLRVGQLDANLDLLLDPAALAGSVAVVAAAAVVLLHRAHRDAPAAVARVLAMAAAGLLVATADGWLVLGVGAIALSAGLFGESPRLLVARVAGDALLAVAAAGMFWGLGGSWVEGAFVPDLRPRFAAVGARSDLDASGAGALSLTAYAGAIVYVDDARVPLLRAPNEPLRAPFVRAPVPGGRHTLRVHVGGGLDDSRVGPVLFGGGREVTLVPLGSTLTHRGMADQLPVVTSGEPSLGSTLASRRAPGGPVPEVATLLAGLALLASLVASAGSRAEGRAPDGASPEALARVTPLLVALVPAVAMVRLDRWLAYAPTARAVLACAAGLAAVLGALLARRAAGLSPARVGASLGALALLAAAADAPLAALGFALVGGGSFAVAPCSWAPPRGARGIDRVPWGVVGLLGLSAELVGHALAGSLPRAVGLVAGATALLALALLASASGAGGPPRGRRGWPAVAAAASALVATTSAWSLGGQGGALVSEWLGPGVASSVAATGGVAAPAGLLLSIGGAGAGWALAGRGPAPQPTSPPTSSGTFARVACTFDAIDRWVFRAVASAGVGALRAAAFAVHVLDREVIARPLDALAQRVVGLGAAKAVALFAALLVAIVVAGAWAFG